MAYAYKKGLDSFWHVERKYNDTKPLVSKHHKKEDDLRPAHRRDRKWEHIVKLSPTSYALCDAGHGDPIFTRDYVGRDRIPTSIVDTYNLSPIVWDIQLQPDGSYLETVKVRNGSGDGAHTSRYQFLAEFLPVSLRYFGDGGGRQYIAVANEADRAPLTKYYLPKSRSVDAVQWDYYVNHKHSQHWAEHYQREDDHKYLVFARQSKVPDHTTSVGDIYFGDWALISPEFKPVNPKSRVDKARKKELKPHLDEFWQWACSVGKMLPIRDWEYVRDAKNQLRKANVMTSSQWASSNSYDSDKIQHILTTSDHELRLPLLTMFMVQSDMNHATTPEDAKKVRRQFNQWANRACGLVTTTKGE
jgi:hypothetical protein